MATSAATSVTAYLDSLPADRRAALSTVRATIRKNLPRGFVEGMGYGMITYHVPLEVFPDTYNRQPLCVAALASQKSYMSAYLMACVDPATERWFQAAYAATGKKLDMGKSCLRFKRVEDVALDVVGAMIARVTPRELIARHEEVHGDKKKPAARKPAARKPAARKPAARKPAARKPAAPAKKKR
jgi:hypothetical protein